MRRSDALLSANKPVNLLVLGPPLANDEDEAIVRDLASVATLKGRGIYPDDLQHLTEGDWEELEVVLLTNFSDEGIEVRLVSPRDQVELSIPRASSAGPGT